MPPAAKQQKTRIPQLRTHQSGNFFCRWGGRDHYFGHDQDEAQAKYIECLSEWRIWREARKLSRPSAAGRCPTVESLVDQFIESRRIEVSHDADRYYRYHLKRFTHYFGRYQADWITPKNLNALKLTMIRAKFAPKTINHDLTAIRVMYNWASGLELVKPINFKGVKNVALGAVGHESFSIEAVHGAIINAPERVRPWLAINYLCLMRPSEVVRLVNCEGQWVGDGVFRLDRGKMDRRATVKRHVIVSPLARAWLACCEKHWSRLDSYGQYCRLKGTALMPKQLQKAGADHLVNTYDADPGDVELLLGHVPTRLRVTYYQRAWPRLLETISRLGLRSVYAERQTGI